MGQSEKQKRRALQQELTNQLANNAKLVDQIEAANVLLRECLKIFRTVKFVTAPDDALLDDTVADRISSYFGASPVTEREFTAAIAPPGHDEVEVTEREFTAAIAPPGHDEVEDGS